MAAGIQTITLQDQVALANLADIARGAGCPDEQILNFVRGGYFPLNDPEPGYWPFHAACREADRPGGPEWIALGGKRGPGKSHAILAQVGLDDCQRFDGLKWLYLRKLMKSAGEALEDMALRVFSKTDCKITEGEVYFRETGSRIVMGGYKDDKDIEKYLGIEYDGIAIGEATQITESKKDRIRGSLRSSKPRWRPRIYMDTNPDGIGLLWFKNMFVEPARKGEQRLTRFFDVSHIKNPFTNPEYNAWLDTLTGPLGKAWKEGNWDAFAGMAFPMWDRDAHVCAPFAIPQHWPKWRAVDWGFASPFATGWFTKDPDTKHIYVYREAYAAGLSDRAQAEMILTMTPSNELIVVTYADPSMWTRKSKENEIFSTYDEYKKAGVILTPGDNDRTMGKRKVNDALSLALDGLPELMIFDTCPHLIEQLSSLACDPHNPEDVDTSAEDHAYDYCRYGLTNERAVQSVPPTEQKIRRRTYKYL